MKPRHLLLALAVTAGVFALAGCKKPAETASRAQRRRAGPQGRDRRPVHRARQRRISRKMLPGTRPRRSGCPRPTSTTTAAAVGQGQRALPRPSSTSWIEQSRKFEGQQMSPRDRARDPAAQAAGRRCRRRRTRRKLAELTEIATKMEGMYGAGKYCTGEGDAKKCRQLGELEDVLRSQPRLRRAARRLAGLAHHRAADAQGLHALRRAGQRRRHATWASPTPASCGARATT